MGISHSIPILIVICYRDVQLKAIVNNIKVRINYCSMMIDPFVNELDESAAHKVID